MASEKGSFTVREAAERTGVPPHRVRYYGGKWARAGYGRLIAPGVVDAGQGTAMRFSRANLVQLRVAFLLRETGLSEEETRDLLAAKGAGGKNWWDPARPLGSDALLLVRGAPRWPALDRWHLCTTDLCIQPPPSWAAAVIQAAGLECELVHARFQAGWQPQPRYGRDRQDCWVLEGASEAWVVNVGQIRRAVSQ